MLAILDFLYHGLVSFVAPYLFALFCLFFCVFVAAGYFDFLLPIFFFFALLAGRTQSSSLQQSANSPAIEAMLSFHDLLLGCLMPILLCVFFFVIFLLVSSPSWRFFSDSQPLEFTWTFLPFVLLFILVFPSLSLLYLLDEVGLPSSTTQAIGHQWYWSYEQHDLSKFSSSCYLSPSELRLLGTDASLFVPSSLVLRFLVSSSDVLHSWTIPSWGLKADAVPGRLNQLSAFLERPGVFFGQCSEICGSNHSFMPIKVEVQTV